MQISTTRFGTLSIDDADIISFPQGLIGMESCRRWMLLADARTPALGWLQCVDRPDVALAVVSPQRFVSTYQVRVSRRDVEPLGVRSADEAQVLAIVSDVKGRLALNLKAPLVIHLETRLGRQVIAKDDHPVQHIVGSVLSLRRSA
jgi:flagellar assembly factor FliW